MPDPQLTELLDVIQGRLNDAVTDLQAAARCIQAYKNDPTGAQACILDYLRTGGESTPKIRASH